jgi:hypothetical protein
MNLPERFEVRTNYTLNTSQNRVCIFMFFLGLVAIPVGGLLLILVSLGVWFFSRYMSKKHPVAIILTHEGIEHIAPFTNKLMYFLPWKDIDGFCSLVAKRHGFIVIARYVGVRLKRYEGYFNNVTSTVNSEIYSGKLSKFMSSMTENMMLQHRKKYNCEIMIIQNYLDRSIPAFINLLEEYHQAFGGGYVGKP